MTKMKIINIIESRIWPVLYYIYCISEVSGIRKIKKTFLYQITAVFLLGKNK